jgi:hypothetical protein
LRRHAFQLELLDSVLDLIAIQPQQTRCPGLIPPASLECLDDERSFELVELDSVGGKCDPFGQARRPTCHGEIGQRERFAFILLTGYSIPENLSVSGSALLICFRTSSPSPSGNL